MPMSEDLWHFLTLTDALAEHGDFATTRIGAVPVVVQNFRGALKGFRNICSHRFALIHSDPAGSGLLRCPYHGWTYDADGVPTGIPFNDSDFSLNKDARRELALVPVAVDACGRFVFVRVGQAGPPLAAQLGDEAARLPEVSQGFPRVEEAGSEPENEATTLHVPPNLDLVVIEGGGLRVEGHPPPGADERFRRCWALRPEIAS